MNFKLWLYVAFHTCRICLSWTRNARNTRGGKEEILVDTCLRMRWTVLCRRLFPSIGYRSGDLTERGTLPLQREGPDWNSLCEPTLNILSAKWLCFVRNVLVLIHSDLYWKFWIVRVKQTSKARPVPVPIHLLYPIMLLFSFFICRRTCFYGLWSRRTFWSVRLGSQPCSWAAGVLTPKGWQWKTARAITSSPSQPKHRIYIPCLFD